MTQTAAMPTGPKLFTYERAQAALVLVRRIVADVVDHHNELAKLRRRIERVEMGLSKEKAGYLEDDRARLMDRLRELVAELEDIGADLVDFEVGIVTFATVTGEGDRVIAWSLRQPDSLHLVKPDEIHTLYKRRAKRRGAPAG